MGDGVADDSNALEMAFVAAGRYDGDSTIYLDPAKTYRTARTIRLEHGASRVTVSGGGTWLSEPTGDGGGFHHSIGVRYRAFEDEYPLQTFTSATKGEAFIDCDSTPDLTVGDYVLVMTGQVHDASSLDGYPVGWPDSEINRVTGVDGVRVHLQWPLAKDYEQEYWADVADGLGDTTTTVVSAYPAPIGVRKIVPFVGLHFDGITIRHTSSAGAFIEKGPFVDLQFTDLDVDTDGMFMSIDGWTGSMSGCSIRVRSENGWWFTTAYSARSVDVSDCEFTADTVGYVHIHEGSADVSLTNVEITNASAQPYDDDYPYVVGLRGRGYDVLIDGLTITNARAGGQGMRIDGAFANASPGITGSATDYSFSGTGTSGGPGKPASHRNESALFTVNGVAGAPW